METNNGVKLDMYDDNINFAAIDKKIAKKEAEKQANKPPKKVTNPRGSNERRKSALKRLEVQLKTGQKRTLPLTKEDIARINKEIAILKTRI